MNLKFERETVDQITSEKQCENEIKSHNHAGEIKTNRIDFFKTFKDIPLDNYAPAGNSTLKFLKCPYESCTRIFKEKGNLRTHIRVHTGERPFVCTSEKCGKAFITLGNLKSHICNHTGEKPFACPFAKCGKKYSRLCRLKIHQRTHTGEKPYKCEFPDCGKTFNEKGNLKTHHRIHTGEKPYVCKHEGCNQAFKAHGHLKDHLKRHLNLRPYTCTICEAKFARSSTLKIHYHTHSGDRPFKCPFQGCNRKFSEKGNMKTHFKTHGNFLIEEGVNYVNSSEGKKCELVNNTSSCHGENLSTKDMTCRPKKPSTDVQSQEAITSPEFPLIGQMISQSNEGSKKGACQSLCQSPNQLSPYMTSNESINFGIPPQSGEWPHIFPCQSPMNSFLSHTFPTSQLMGGLMNSYGLNAINPYYHVYLNNLMQHNQNMNINFHLNPILCTNIMNQMKEFNHNCK